jgi:hypothetical protein
MELGRRVTPRSLAPHGGNARLRAGSPCHARASSLTKRDVALPTRGTAPGPSYSLGAFFDRQRLVRGGP